MNGRSRRAARCRRPWLVVAIVGLIAGLGFALITPPLAGYDETVHFLRAYQVSQGHLIATHHGTRLGGSVPVETQHDLAHLLVDLNQLVFHGPHGPSSPATYLRRVGDPAPKGPASFVDFPSAAVYSPVPYVPAAALIAIGRALGASTLALLYLGRLGSLLATVFLLALATRRMPTRAWILASVAMLPVVIVQAAMLSADGVTLALALLVVALALDVAATPRGAVSRRRLIEIGLATVALGFAKPPYILFALAFAIPWRRHARAVKQWLVGAVGAGFVAAASWGAYASTVYVAPRLPPSLAPLGVRQFAAYTDVDPKRQERFMIHHPWFFVKTIARTLSAFSTRLLRESVAQVPLWSLPMIIVLAALVVLAFAVVANGTGAAEARTEPLLGWRSRVFLVALAGFTFVTLMALAYTGWNAVGSPRIEAFQGRYLLPLIPLLLLAVPPVRIRAIASADGWAATALAIASPTVLAVVAIALWSHLY